MKIHFFLGGGGEVGQGGGSDGQGGPITGWGGGSKVWVWVMWGIGDVNQE